MSRLPTFGLLILILALVLSSCVFAAGDSTADEAIQKAIAILEAEKEQTKNPAEQTKLANAIAALERLLPKEKDANPQINQKLLNKKFHGAATYKDGVLTLVYDFKNVNQLKDFDVGDAKPVVSKDGGLQLAGGESIKHKVSFKTLTLTGLIGIGNMKGTHILTTGGSGITSYHSNGGVSWIVHMRAGKQGGLDEKFATESDPPRLYPFELAITEKRVALKFGGISLGQATMEPLAGQVELLGGDGGNLYRNLRMVGAVDAAWAKTFFAE